MSLAIARKARSYGQARSVLRDRRIHVRPGVDAAGDVVDLGEAEMAEMLGDLGAACAVVAEERQRGAIGQRFAIGGTVVEVLEVYVELGKIGRGQVCTSVHNE